MLQGQGTYTSPDGSFHSEGEFQAGVRQGRGRGVYAGRRADGAEDGSQRSTRSGPGARLSAPPTARERPLAGTLAREFDLTRVAATAQRSVANWWVRWAGERTHDLFNVWKDAANRADLGRRLAAAVGAPAFVRALTELTVL